MSAIAQARAAGAMIVGGRRRGIGAVRFHDQRRHVLRSAEVRHCLGYGATRFGDPGGAGLVRRRHRRPETRVFAPARPPRRRLRRGRRSFLAWTFEDSGVIANHDNSKAHRDRALAARSWSKSIRSRPSLRGTISSRPTPSCVSPVRGRHRYGGGTVTRLSPATVSAAALDTLVAELIDDCVGNAAR